MRIHLVEPYHSPAMRRCVEPLLSWSDHAWTFTEGPEPDWKADLNHFVPWHGLIDQEPQGKASVFYTHCNPGMEDALRQACARAVAVVAMTKDGERELRAIGVTTPIHIVPLPVDDFAPRRQTVLVVGAEQPNGRKRSWLLLELAWRMSREDLNALHFCIIGTGWEGVVSQLHNLGASVEHRASVSHEGLKAAYHGADVLLSTGFREGGPLPVVEALASGLPVISPRYGYAAEFPEACHYYEDVDGLISELRAFCVKPLARAELVNRFTSEAYLKAHAALFTALVPVLCHEEGRLLPPPGIPQSRYEWVTRIVEETGAHVLMEIGTGTGERAEAMIRTAQAVNGTQPVRYYGFDYFRQLTLEELRRERSKQPWSQQAVESRLRVTGADIRTFAGDSRETVPNLHISEQPGFIFVDGGHSWETVEADWANLQRFIGPETVVLFDDYYPPAYHAAAEIDGVGCQQLLIGLGPEWNTRLLSPVEAWKQEDGRTLHIAMAKVQRA